MMKLFNLFNKNTPQKKEIIVEDNFSKGERFEKYVKTVMFDERNYVLARETPSNEKIKERFIEDCVNPDFTFRTKDYRSEYINVEAKFRNIKNIDDAYNIKICSERQLFIYKNADKYSKTFIALGVGNSPEELHLILIIPVKYIDSNIIHLPKYISDFWFYKNKSVFPNHLYRIYNLI